MTVLIQANFGKERWQTLPVNVRTSSALISLTTEIFLINLGTDIILQLKMFGRLSVPFPGTPISFTGCAERMTVIAVPWKAVEPWITCLKQKESVTAVYVKVCSGLTDIMAKRRIVNVRNLVFCDFHSASSVLSHLAIPSIH